MSKIKKSREVFETYKENVSILAKQASPLLTNHFYVIKSHIYFNIFQNKM